MGIKFGAKALNHIIETLEASFSNGIRVNLMINFNSNTFNEYLGKIEVNTIESSVMVGIRKKQLTTTPIKLLEKETDFE